MDYYIASRNGAAIADGLRSEREPMLAETGLIPLLLPALKAAIPGALADMPWPEGAISEKEREARINELNPQIKKLKTDLAELNALADQLKLQ